MTKMNWTKWAAGAVVAGLAMVAMPAVGQARHYTGVAPASVTPVTMTSTKHATVKATATKKHTKLATHKKKLHAKHKPSTKLHAKKKHSTLSKTTKKA